jgi:cytosine/adenosine deaminase-related metal-dependent hydrolase
VHPEAIKANYARAIDEGTLFSIHCDEDEAERRFLLDGGGPWREFHTSIGRDLSGWRAPGVSPVRYLDQLGVLGRQTLLVHCTLTEGEDLDMIKARDCTVALCARSNLHITGRLPDVRGMLARGIPIVIGTDSLASTPDLDLLLEGAALRAAFPDIEPEHWLWALTYGARARLNLQGERLAPDALEVDAPDIASLFDGTRWARRWLA